MEVANASLLDEATAAAEAMTMLQRVQTQRIDAAGGAPQFFVADSCFPQTIDVLRARAEPLGIELVVGDLRHRHVRRSRVRRAGADAGRGGRVHDLRAVHRPRARRAACWSRSAPICSA